MLPQIPVEFIVGFVPKMSKNEGTASRNRTACLKTRGQTAKIGPPRLTFRTLLVWDFVKQNHMKSRLLDGTSGSYSLFLQLILIIAPNIGHGSLNSHKHSTSVLCPHKNLKNLDGWLSLGSRVCP